MTDEPTSLEEAIFYFANPDNCLNYLVSRRWPNGVVCPVCGSTALTFVPSRRVWQCKTRHPRYQFSVKVGTVFEESPIALDKWLIAIWMVANSKSSVSSYEVRRVLHITQKSAWFMLHRIRLALMTEPQEEGAEGNGGEAREPNASKSQFRPGRHRIGVSMES
jgi:transposase-like protein